MTLAEIILEHDIPYLIRQLPADEQPALHEEWRKERELRKSQISKTENQEEKS